MKFFSKLCAQIALISMVSSNEEHEYIDCPNWPKLFILGTQKAGTTSLYEALAEHPRICQATLKEDDPEYYAKEVHYFDLLRRLENGSEFYCSYFQGCDNHLKRYNRVGSSQSHTRQNFIHADFTPGYLDFEIAGRMKKTFPPSARKKMKMIVVLREPVRRMLSWYNHVVFFNLNLDEDCPDPSERHHFCQRLLRKNFKGKTIPALSGLRTVPTNIEQGDGLSEQLSFQEFVLTDFRTVARSKYLDILKEYYEVFDMENILVLNMDWMMEHQGRTLKLISKFVGIDSIWKPDSLLPYINDNVFDAKLSLEDVDCGIVEELDNFYKPHNEELYKFLRENKDKFWHGQPYFRRFKETTCNKV